MAPLINIPNMKQTNKEVEEKTEGAKEEFGYLEISGKTIKSVSDLRQEKGLKCTIKQFLTYSLDLSPSAKSKIVKSQMPIDDPEPKRKGGFTWFRHALGPIKEAIISSNSASIIRAISELKVYEYDQTSGNDRYDIPNCIETLMKYHEFKLPEPFNHLGKTEIELKETSIVVNGITINLKPDLVFTSNWNGKPVVGAVKFIARKENPLGASQLRMGAHLIHEYLQTHKSNFEGEIMRQLCIYIDVVHHKVAIAPEITSTPHREIRDVCNSFAEMWSQELAKRSLNS